MADQKNHDSGAVTMSQADLAAAIAAAVSQAVKAQNEYKDPQIVANKERTRAAMQRQNAENLRNKDYRESMCSHTRDDNSSRVAWITNYVAATGRMVTEGFCQLCEKHFHPEKEGYAEMIRISTGKSGIVY
jgi:hypothetical protein